MLFQRLSLSSKLSLPSDALSRPLPLLPYAHRPTRQQQRRSHRFTEHFEAHPVGFQILYWLHYVSRGSLLKREELPLVCPGEAKQGEDDDEEDREEDTG